ncbi:NUDIX hydrolase [Candidatus Woesearchaeota archaeon]|nr:NUDIX hydrolase [Nanoarchaeota archaeon]MCB9370451.1 NUDIX hydrolase [Candidatus Woesearchaeota archaeon]USN43529.1 MAG: NUDIX hydrolase [Candidatus Woesearchaeota archaeon]
MGEDETLFQYCQKLVIFSKDKTKILLCKRKGEADFDGIFSFPGGKMETSDASLENGVRREKREELGTKCRIKVFFDFVTNEFYVKKNGTSMVLPHYYGIFEEGEIEINEEYSEYKWVKLSELEEFEPKIQTIDGVVKRFLQISEVLEESQKYVLL